jgi:elongation factor 1-gamma
LTESNAIAYFLANEELRGGSCVINQALVQQWLYFADSDILPASCTWVFPTLGIMQFNKTSTERAKEDVKKALQVSIQKLVSEYTGSQTD